MKSLTRQQVRRIDRYAIETRGMPGAVLMETAGRNAAGAIEAFLGGAAGKSIAKLQIKALSELDSLSQAIFSADGSSVRLLTANGERTFNCRTGGEIRPMRKPPAKPVGK